MTRSRISGLYGNSSFLGNHHIVRNCDCTILHSHQSCRRLPFPSRSLQLLRFVNFWMMVILIRVMSYLIVVLICISLINCSDVYPFMCLLAIYVYSLEKCLFTFLYIFLTRLLRYFSFDIELYELFVYFESETILCCIICEYFLLVNRLLCHFIYGFLFCAKAFQFSYVPFVCFLPSFFYPGKKT